MRLHEQVKVMEKNVATLNEEITELLIYLASSKFQGVENNFVNAREMYDKIARLRRMVMVAQGMEEIDTENRYYC